MLRTRLYYTVKPYVPWRVRMAIRRFSARRRLALSKDAWPINQAAAREPEHWTGWPNGHQFAVVLTHDVEGSDGLAKCDKLMQLERKLGFVSSFNFIPEGPYRTTPEFRAQVSQNGFEVGVHDLRHDGKLFHSESVFKAHAERINYYLHEWQAAGFRSGFMLRNLNWIYGLDVEYDSSTFDTDPFELQPDGAGTIFPFWIPRRESRLDPAPRAENGNRPGRGGYVELPYTLPQDSTLFFVLGETSPDIWLKKLDWIACHHGMMLVNIHPDYIRFEGEADRPRTYDYRHYVQLLEYIRDRYAGQYWNALPRHIAGHVKQMLPRPTVHLPRRIAMVTHSFYESDNRVTRYAESLAERGDHVDVFSLRSAPGMPVSEVLNGVNVHRIQNRFGKAQKSKLEYFWPLIRFLMRSSWKITRYHARGHYDLLHIHNMPDFLVFAAWYPKLTGAKIVLDIHDIVPEFFGSKFASQRDCLSIQLLKRIERVSARFANHVIISNHLWQARFATRTGTEDRCSVFINNVDTRTFRANLRSRHDDRLIILFPGGLQWHQGLDIALRAFTRVAREVPNAEFHIYGDGIMKPALIALAHELGFNGKVKFFEPVRITQIAAIMANADLGVVPKRADSFGSEAYSTKIMEFMSLGVPVVVSKTPVDQFYFNESVVRFFESGNSDALADAMIELLCDRQRRQRLASNAIEYSRQNSWESRKPEYLRLIDSLA